MDTSSLQTFVTVADRQSFSAAAELLHLTQPAVSKRIFSLESELGVQLFHRIGRHIQLTEAGQLFHQKATIILQQLNEITLQIDNLSGNIAGTLHLGTSHHIGLHHLPPVLKHFNQQYPQVDLELAFMDSESACAQILSGALELAVITLPNKMPKMLESRQLWSDELKVVIAKDHLQTNTLMNVKTPYESKFQILQSISAILPKGGTYTRDIIDSEFQKHNITIQDNFTTNYLETIKMMVKAGLGWSVLPQTMLEKDLQQINLGEFQVIRQLGIVRHQKRSVSNAANKMIETVTKMRKK